MAGEQTGEKMFRPMTLQEAAEELDVTVQTVYRAMRKLRMKTKRYGQNPHAYLTREQLEEIRRWRDEPWTFEGSERIRGENNKEPAYA